MNAFRSITRQPLLLAGLVFLVTALLTSSVIVYLQRHRLLEARARVADHSGVHSLALARSIDQALSATYALAALIQQEHGRVEQFEVLARHMLLLYPSVSVLAVVPDKNIEGIVATAKDEKVPWREWLKHTLGSKTVEFDQVDDKLTLAGPFKLIPGELAVIGRLPVFQQETQGRATIFGSTLVVLRMSDALEPAHLGHLVERGFHYKLWQKIPGSEKQYIITESSPTALIDPVEEIVSLPKTEWILSVSPAKGWGDPLEQAFDWVVGLLFSLLLASLVKLLVDIQLRRKTLESLVTERTREIQATRNLLETTIEVIPDVIVYKDGDGRWLITNELAKEMFHLRNIDWQNKTGQELAAMLPEFRQAHETCLQDDQITWQHGSIQLFEEHFLDQQGRLRIFDVRKTPLFDDHGQREGMVVIGTDMTETKLRENHLKLAAKVFEQSSEGFMITDADNRIVRVNQAFTAISGYSETEVLGQTPQFFASGKQDDQFYQSLWATIHENGHWKGELWDRRKNGEVFPKLISISSVLDDSDQVSHYVTVFSDISTRKASEAQLEFLAHHDPLTRLPNRLMLFERLTHCIERSNRETKLMALLVLDLDHFKDVNDNFGHLAGDQLLQQVAERLSLNRRESDTVVRLGGDEFTVLLEDITYKEDAARIAENIIVELSAPYFLPLCGESRIGVSVGISLYPEHGDNPEMLLQQADTALYVAKAKSRGSYAYYSDELTQSVRARMDLEARLRRAIEKNELRVYYQPQMDIATDRMIGAEALVRWLDPDHGLILPSQFIPIAEKTGLIIPLGAWVLREACRQGKQWLDRGLPALTLAVNLSPQQFSQCNITTVVATILRDTGFPIHLLELELTESGLMEHPEQVVALLNSLCDLGIRLAIDDFGTGYSSLACLKRFPLDVLKIDKTFIDDIPLQQDDREIAATIIAMGHMLGFKVLAEGVETAEQLDFLRKQGCDRYQGYLKSKPLDADSFEVLLRGEYKAEE